MQMTAPRPVQEKREAREFESRAKQIRKARTYSPSTSSRHIQMCAEEKIIQRKVAIAHAIAAQQKVKTSFFSNLSNRILSFIRRTAGN